MSSYIVIVLLEKIQLITTEFIRLWQIRANEVQHLMSRSRTIPQPKDVAPGASGHLSGEQQIYRTGEWQAVARLGKRATRHQNAIVLG